MVFRRTGSTTGRRGNARGETWYTAPTLPGFGRVGPWTTGATTRRTAERVEAWLREQSAERPDLVQGLIQRRYSLAELWVAVQMDRVDALLLDERDPLLAGAAAAFSEITRDERVRHGLEPLSDLATEVERRRGEAQGRRPAAPGTLRLSWLLVPRNVTELYDVARRQGRTPNSVRRSIHRAVADLLAHHYGKARRNEVMADVAKPSSDDRREVRITTEEIRRVLNACDEEFREFVALAMLLAVARDPLLQITPRHFDEAVGTLEVLDTKTTARPRTLVLPSPAWSILRRRAAGRAADERLFGWTPHQVRHRWEAVRDAAAGNQTRNRRERRSAPDPVRAKAERLLEGKGVVTLPVLRFKDLRHLLPTAWNALGLPAEDLPEIMGWAKGSHMAERYTTARIVGERENMDRVVAFLGLNRLDSRTFGGTR